MTVSALLIPAPHMTCFLMKRKLVLTHTVLMTVGAILKPVSTQHVKSQQLLGMKGSILKENLTNKDGKN